MNEKLKAMIEASGALAEMAKIFYDSFLAAEFTGTQALELTKAIIARLLTPTQTKQDFD